MEATIRIRTLIAVAGAMVAGVVVTLVVMWSMQADAAPGDTDSTFVPITPCRLIDTRPPPVRVGPHDAFGANETKTIQAHGANGSCTIPTDAVGLSLNVSAVNATTLSDVRIWDAGGKPPAAAINPSPSVQVAFNAVTTPLAGNGTFKIFNSQGSVDLIVDVNGFYTESSLQDLHARLSTLEALTASMSLEVVDGQPTLRYTGVNIQIVDGSGTTDGAVNGRGNLIVGYNENNSDTRTGSHNLAIGKYHTYTASGGLVAGFDNSITGTSSSVTGGTGNGASGNFSSVSGGTSNTSSGSYSSVTGGSINTAGGQRSSISGGNGNSASADYSSVTGGSTNTASGTSSSVTGGRSSTASGSYSSVSGGYLSSAGGDYSSVSGGSSRAVSGAYDWRAGTLFETN